MVDYARAAMGFGHMYFSLWIGMWMKTEEDEELIGKLLATWFTVFYCRYGISKLLGEGDMDCMHRSAMYYWFALLFHALWQKAYFLHSRRATQTWMINFCISVYVIRLNYIMSRHYDAYSAEKLWSNSEIEDNHHGIFDYMSYAFLLTYISLIYHLDKAIFLLWTFMLIDAVSINTPGVLMRQAME